MHSTATNSVRELDQRATDGLEVTLLWDSERDVASVEVVDTKTGEEFEIAVGENDNALDVFNHPYAYAARRGLLDHVPEADYAAPLAA
jgi:hypothetical protein